ncbi:MAG: thioredoxin-dependent thiol peroxidase [Spirochaetes bacterium]|nr:thioredoxin-dependent thiol peroxidase [Spirochaetota bacterium]
MATRKNDLKPGRKAPALTLPDGLGNKVSLADYKGKWVVLYFYPKDDTPGCTTEALDFTARKAEFEKLNAVILGVSPDSEKSHCKFAEKHGLSVTLLSDVEKKALESYGVWQKKKQYGREYMGVVRTTYLIDPAGKVARMWDKVRVDGHADAVLDAIRELVS